MRLRPPMRITTHVAIGLLLMAGLLIGTLAYQLSQVDHLQGINREISLTNLEAARISIGLLQGLDEVYEFAQRYSVLPDADYRARWEEWEAAVETDLQALSLVGLSESEEAVRTRIEDGWAEYREIAPQFAEQPVQLLPDVQGILAEVRTQTEELIAVNEAVVAERAAASAETGDRAQWVARVSAASALLLAAILSLLLYRSISGPLRRLTRGTREIAQGRFDHRLRISGPRELSSLARDFDRMAARLDELEDLKRDFLSHVSHELKTPLAAIQETIEILLEEIPGPLTPKQERLLLLSRTSSTRLSSMILDLLELSRLEAGASSYEPSWEDASAIALSVLEELEPVAEEQHLRLSLRRRSETMRFVCDGKRMREVLANLVSNAVKFSPEGGTVRVSISEVDDPPAGMAPSARGRPRNERSPFVLFSVEDEGPGVPEEHREGIFEKFHQINPGERLRGQGVGLGLAIARRIVQAHGGTIWVEDAPNGGSMFRVLVPRIPSQWRNDVSESPPGEPMPAPAAQEEPRILREVKRPSGVALGVLGVLTLSGCVGALTETEEPEPEPGPPSEATVTAPATVEPPTEVHFSPEQLRLSTAWSFLAGGDYEDAREQFQALIENEERRDVRGQAVWGMALVHLLPESPLRDPEWANTLLDYLERQYSNGPLGIQAAWAQGMLGDLDEVRGTVAQQEAALRQLTETVDQLKSIDLNRSPVRNRAVRPDSLPARIFDP